MTERIAGRSGNQLEVGSLFAARVSARPLDSGLLGSYSFSVTTGIIAAALAAGGVLASFRWGDATRLAVIHRLAVKFQALTLFTAAQQVDFGFDAYVGRTFSASHTGGGALTITGNSMKKRATMGSTLVTEIRVATTAALGGGTVTPDAHPFAASLGDQQRINPAAATEEQRTNDPTLIWNPDVIGGEFPIVLAQNEGILIRNRTVWPAAGTGIFQIDMAWSEVTEY